MKTHLISMSFARAASAFFLVLAGSIFSPSAHAQLSNWNAYRDFYLSPGASGWAGATSPSSAGSAWGYYAANVNGFGLPTQIGSYFTPEGTGTGTQNLYKYSSYSPLGGTSSVGSVLWDSTGGTGFPRYVDNQGWGSSLGRYDVPWFGAVPAINNAMWLQAGYLGSASAEGIGSVLTWTAPAPGIYDLSGSFQIGDNGAGSGASTAIVASTGEVLLARSAPAMGSNQSFSFRKSFKQGDVVQFQVGTDFKTGAVVALQAEIVLIEDTSWDAYTDFYLSPGASGWAGATSPSSAGSAWGYYAANVNGFGLPTQIGSYFTPEGTGTGTQNLYKYSSYSPLGGTTSVSSVAWDSTGGTGFGRYNDNAGWGSSLGRYDVPWFGGAPAVNNVMWLQAGYLGSASAEGIGSVLTWTAPAPGIYDLSGSFQIGDNGAGSGASTAIVASTGEVLLARSAPAMGSNQSFSFRKSFKQGDVVQFQVGTDFKTGAAVGLRAKVTRVQRNFSAFGEFWMSGNMYTPVPEGLSGGGPEAWSNVGNATLQGRSPGTPTFPNAWSYGLVNGTGGTVDDIYPTSIVGNSPEGTFLRAGWQQFFDLTEGVTGLYADSVPLWLYSASGAQIGWYGRAWYNEAPGNDGVGAGRNGISETANSNKNYLFMRVGTGANDGTAPVVRWTAPASGTYRFQGEFLPGGNGSGTMSYAVLTYNNPDLEEGTGTIVLNRQTVAHDGDAQPFDFNLTVVQGQTVSWVVGADGDATGDVMGLQADVTPVKTSLTLSGVSVADKTYNRNNSATLQGTPTLVGVSPGDDVSLTNVVAIFDSPNAGSRNVSIAADLVGADASKYILNLPTGITGTINKATPTIDSVPTASAITQGQTLASSILSGGAGSVAGTFAWTTSSTIPLSTADYPVTFTPADGANYNTASTSVNVTVNPAASTGSSFTSWRGTNPASAELLQNFAFGASTPADAVSRASLPAGSVSNGSLVLTYFVRKEATNPDLVVPQFSTNLGSSTNWSGLPAGNIATVSTNTVNGVEVLKKTASVPVDSTSRKFLRLKIQE